MLILSAKLGTPGLLKTKLFKVISTKFHNINKILSSDSQVKLLIDVLM